MPRTVADPALLVRHTNSDGSVLSARLERRKEGTYAIDLRRWSRGRPTLKPDNSDTGTKDLEEARRLARRELAAIANGTSTTATAAAIVGPLEQAEEYLNVRKNGGHMSEDTAANAYVAISRCWAVLHEKTGAMRWRDVTRADIPTLISELKEREFRGARLSNNSVLNYCNYVKGFYRYLVDTGAVAASPIHRHGAVPARDTSYEAPWLEPHGLGLLLETSFRLRDVDGAYRHNACRQWPEILATECYTGAREDEVLGVAVSELRLGKFGAHGVGTITYQDNRWRKLKNRGSERTVSLWPAHAAILRDYVARERPARDGLLFPGRGGRMWGELRESMSRDLKAAGLASITDHGMRHSYISARGRMYKEIVRRGRIVLAPVHYKDIQLEVGHTSEAMRKVYDHASAHPVEGWVELDYARALREYRKGLGRTSAPVASKRARRSSAARSASSTTRVTGPRKPSSATRKR